jgi:hypothetical protein
MMTGNHRTSYRIKRRCAVAHAAVRCTYARMCGDLGTHKMYFQHRPRNNLSKFKVEEFEQQTGGRKNSKRGEETTANGGKLLRAVAQYRIGLRTAVDCIISSGRIPGHRSNRAFHESSRSTTFDTYLDASSTRSSRLSRFHIISGSRSKGILPSQPVHNVSSRS